MRIESHLFHPPLNHTWRLCFGQGAATELLRADCLRHVRKAKVALGFRYLRFHGLFHDDMAVVTRREDGSLCFHWQRVDEVFDRLLQMGVRPFVELGPMPLAIASGDTTIFHWRMNVTPPGDFAEWEQLVREFTLHCVRRHGLDEVRQWFFEVWNEPNLAGFWTGTQADYWELYRRAALAVKSVDDHLRVGGPATAQARWIPEFIAFCAKSQTPVDFVSTHSYLQDEETFYPHRKGSPHAPSDYLLDQFKRVKEEVAASARPDLEIHWTEWNALSAAVDGTISWTRNRSMDALYCGSFALHHAVRADALCHSQSWWTLSDVFGEDGISPLPWSNTYGLFTVGGIPKASFHAFNWLGRMRGDRLRISGVPDDPAKGILVTQEAGCTRALLWFHPALGSTPDEWTDSLEIDLPGPACLTQGHLGEGHGSAYESWLAMGEPTNLTPTQHDALAGQARPHYRTSRVTGAHSRVSFSLKPYEILFLEWTPAEAPAENRAIVRPAPTALEGNLGAKSS